MLRDLSSISPALSLSPAVRNASANGATADTQGYGSAALIVAFGAYTDGTHTPSAEHSDNGSSWATVPAAELDGAFVAVSSGGGANTVQKVGYLGSKRYLRTVMTIGGASTGAASTGCVLRGFAAQV